MSIKTKVFSIFLMPFVWLNRLLNGFRGLFDKSETKNMLVDLAEEVKYLEDELAVAHSQYDAVVDHYLEEKQRAALLDGAFKHLVSQHKDQTKELADATFKLNKANKERSNLLNQVAELVERNNKEYDELFGAREDLANERAKNEKLKKKLKKLKG